MKRQKYFLLVWCAVITLAMIACALGGAPATETPLALTPVANQPALAQPTEISPTETLPPTVPAATATPRVKGPTVTPPPPMAVVDDACANLVLARLETARQSCADFAGNHVCFTGGAAEVWPVAGDEPSMQPGAVLALDNLQMLHTAQFDLSQEQWGIAVLRLAAPEAFATLLLTGDVMLEPVAGAALPAFTVSTSGNAPQCPGAPNTLVLHTPEDQSFALQLNGVQVDAQGATVVFRAVPGQEMTALVLAGSVTLTAQGGSQTVKIGQMSTLALGGKDGLEAVAPPRAAIAFELDQIEFIPFHIIHPPVEILAGQRWTNTGVQLTAGKAYIVIAAGLMKTYADLPWSSPAGHSAADCGAAGRNDWDCRCRTLPDWGTCTLNEVESMKLVGRVGEGEPFVVGSGGVFTAKTDGELQLGPNDNFFDDNLATYHVIIVVVDMQLP